MKEPKPVSRSQLAYYAELSQVGFEIAGPIGIGALIDSWMGWSPWGVILGTLAGFAGGMTHLIQLANRPEPPSEDSIP